MRTHRLLSDNHTLSMVFVLLYTLIIFLLIGAIFSSKASALTYQSEVTTEFTFNPTLSINLSSSNIIINNLAPGSAADSNIVTVGVTTNTAYGYVLSATAGIKGGNTNLVNTSDSTYKFTNLATTAGAASSLNNIPNDKWGYSYSSDSGSTWVSGDTGSTATGYAGLPLDDNDNANERGKGGTTLISTDSPADSKSIQFKIGAKASTSQPAGTYTNVINFYAVTNPEPETPTLQSMTLADCPTASPLDVTDERDDEVYKVQKLADGKCWMLDNLRLDPTAVSLTDLQGNTNASNQTLTYFKNGGGTTSDKYATAGVANWTSSYSYSAPLVSVSYKDTLVQSYGSGSGKVGVYYNYCAASAGSYCYGNGTSAGTSSGNASEDLCPAGWRMPSSNETLSLCSAYDPDCASNEESDIAATSTSSVQYNLSTPLSGDFSGGSASGQGVGGGFWSSTRSSDYDMYGLNVGADYLVPTLSYPRYPGISLRCLLDS